jgi:hypothetical protein
MSQNYTAGATQAQTESKKYWLLQLKEKTICVKKPEIAFDPMKGSSFTKGARVDVKLWQGKAFDPVNEARILTEKGVSITVMEITKALEDTMAKQPGFIIDYSKRPRSADVVDLEKTNASLEKKIAELQSELATMRAKAR